jgi:hypothetical protein
MAIGRGEIRCFDEVESDGVASVALGHEARLVACPAVVRHLEPSASRWNALTIAGSGDLSSMYCSNSADPPETSS